MRLTPFLVPLLVLGACRSEADFNEQPGSDTWTQAQNDRVDILFVVDDSRTMLEEQTTLAAGFQSFADQLEASATRFHLGVITTTFEYTDPSRGTLIGEPQYFTWEDVDYATRFAERAQVGIDGSDFEKGLDAAAYALSPTAALDLNIGFSRPEARLLVVFVSDEEDCSDAGALGTDFETNGEICYSEREQLVPVEDYVVQFRALRDDPRDVIVSAIVGLDTDGCDTNGDGDPDIFAGERYAEVARLTGGVVGDLCDGDWSTVMTDLGLNATGMFTSFQLSNAAIPDTLEVFVDDVLQDPSVYTYEPETWYIHFDEASLPPRDSVVVANYTVLPGQIRPPGVQEAPADTGL